MNDTDAKVSMMAIVNLLGQVEKDLAEWKRENGLETKVIPSAAPVGLKRFMVRVGYPDVTLPGMPTIQATYSCYAETQKEAEWKVKKLAAASVGSLLRQAHTKPELISHVQEALVTVISADIWRTNG